MADSMQAAREALTRTAIDTLIEAAVKKLDGIEWNDTIPLRMGAQLAWRAVLAARLSGPCETCFGVGKKFTRHPGKWAETTWVFCPDCNGTGTRDLGPALPAALDDAMLRAVVDEAVRRGVLVQVGYEVLSQEHKPDPRCQRFTLHPLLSMKYPDVSGEIRPVYRLAPHDERGTE